MARSDAKAGNSGWRSTIGNALPLILALPTVLIGLFIAGNALWALFGTAFRRWIGG